LDWRHYCAQSVRSSDTPEFHCEIHVKPPFFWPEQYRRTGELLNFFLFDENPGVAFAGRWAPATLP
jgi:hypothetical protein